MVDKDYIQQHDYPWIVGMFCANVSQKEDDIVGLSNDKLVRIGGTNLYFGSILSQVDRHGMLCHSCCYVVLMFLRIVEVHNEYPYD